MNEIELGHGTVRYADSGGDGPVVVLVHGLFVDGTLWRDVVPGLTITGARVVVPELPLGSHRVPLQAEADLSPPGIARLVADLLAALDLRAVTLVGNDTGGAICQLVAADHPERIARLVLTNCDAYEAFFPPAFRYLQVVARVPGGLWMLGQTLRLRPVRRLPIAFGWLTATTIDRERSDRWVAAVATDPGVRRDVRKFLRTVSSRYTIEVAERLRTFHRPALLVWGRKDRFFGPRLAERLAADIPDTRIEWIEGCATFVPVDVPERLAGLIIDFQHTAEKSSR